MKVLLLDPTAYMHNVGLRIIAACLKARGHEVDIIFALGALSPHSDVTERVLAEIGQRALDADLVGVSVYTNYLLEARAATAAVRRVCSAPIVWGGVHATVMPAESMEDADMVCVGDGEDTVPALLDALAGSLKISTVPGLWYRDDAGAVQSNPVGQLAQDLDIFPDPLYQDLDHILVASLTDGSISALTEERLRDLIRYNGRYYGLPDAQPYYGYLAMTSRGCPYRCAYCVNNALNRIYRGQGRVLRFRSVERVIDELVSVRQRFPFINLIHFFDDNLCARSTEDLARFAKLYRERVGLPFKCNLHPANSSEEKIDLLVEAGLVSVEMGIESGSERTNKEVYTRPHHNKSILDVANLLATRHRGRVVSYYDIIMDNPWETHLDVSQTIRLVQDIPRPFRLSHFSLTFFPGTALFQRAMEEGLVTDLVADVVQKKNNRLYADQDPYAKLLLSVSPFVSSKLARGLLKLLASPYLLRLLNSRLPSFLIARLMTGLVQARGWWNQRRAQRNVSSEASPEPRGDGASTASTSG
jgi:anaerobic magnesium-protoporphyrin IX monomethyl ester cyclase